MIRHERINLLHAHLPRAHILAGLARLLTNTRVAATVHGMGVTTHELGITRLVGSHLVLVFQAAYAMALSIGIPGSSMALIPNAVDLQMQTSRVEGMPFALLEAMACGLPTVVINVGGVGKLAVAGVTSMLSANEDWHGPDDAALKLLENPAMMKAMGAAACKRVETNFNLRDRLDQFAGLFTTLARQGGGLAPALWDPTPAPPEWWQPHGSTAKANKIGSK